MIWLDVIPADAAAETDAPLIEWALNVSVSFPANFSIEVIHLAIEDDDIGLWGLIYETNRLSDLCQKI